MKLKSILGVSFIFIAILLNCSVNENGEVIHKGNTRLTNIEKDTQKPNKQKISSVEIQEKVKVNNPNCDEKVIEKMFKDDTGKLSKKQRETYKRLQHLITNQDKPEKSELDKFVKEKINFLTKVTYLDNLEDKVLTPNEIEIRIGYGGGIVTSQMWVLKKRNSTYSGYLMNTVLNDNSSVMKRFDLKNTNSGWQNLFDYLEKNEVKIPLNKELLNDYIHGVDTTGYTLEVKQGTNYNYRWFVHNGCMKKGGKIMEKIIEQLYGEFQKDLPKEYFSQN